LNPAVPTPAVPVAIIGMGCLFPKADSLDRYWINIRDGVDAIRPIPASHWNPDDLYDADPKSLDKTYARRGGFLDPVPFPALDFGIAPANLDATDTTQLLGLMAAKAALDDAGYGAGTPEKPGKPLNRDRVSVMLGVTGALELVIPLGARLGHPIWRRALKEAGVAEPIASDVVQRISDSYVGWQENSFPGLLGNVAAGRIANRLDLGGTNCVVDAACASSLGAVHLALLELAAGRSDVCLTGGLDTFNDIFMYMCFSKTPALSPSGDARPFSMAGDGTALGEGLGVLTLKRLDDARRDGDRIYAVIRGVGSSSDGKGNAVYAPSASGQIKCLNRAYEAAGVSPSTVELVEAHGTGTKVGDAVELSALASVYRSARTEGSWCALGSVKSQIGHTKAAAGVAGLIKAALALHHKVLPPTIKVDQPAEVVAPGASPFYVNTEPRPWLPHPDHPRRAAVSAFGFGGSNFHCVLEEADAETTASPWDGDDQIVAFSGPTPQAIQAELDAWPADSTWAACRVRAAESRVRFRPNHPHRLTIVTDRDPSTWAKRVERARTLLGGGLAAVAPEGVFYGIGTEPGKLAILFPGQGSQYVGMLRGLACRFPSFQSALNEAAEASRAAVEATYPHPLFSDAARDDAARTLRGTHLAQPAIGAVSLGALRVLNDLGVKADAYAGHSFGELTALHAAGRIDAVAFRHVARLRGELMAGDQTTVGDRGGMIAVMAAVDAIKPVLQAETINLVVANQNTPSQTVLSGALDQIARAERAFAAHSIRTKVLEVSAAFHSPIVAAAAQPLRAALAEVAITPGSVPVYGNTSADVYPSDADAARDLFAVQLAEPVRFVEQVEAMARSGVRTFLEVGPGTTLTGMVGAILGETTGVTALALDASKGKVGGIIDLARTLARLAALGHPVRLDAWDGGLDQIPKVRKAGLTVPVSGANFAPKPVDRPAIQPAVAVSTPTRPAATSTIPSPRKPDPAMPLPPSSSPRPKANPTPTPSTNGAAHRLPANVPPLTIAAPSSLLSEALRASQANLAALQRMGEQTANLHRQFLEGQDRATQTFQSLLDHQQQLALGAIGWASAPVQAPLAIPAPTPPIAVAPPVPAPRPVAPGVSRPVAPLQPRVAAVAPVAKPVATRPAATRVGTSTAAVHAALSAVVAEKTGYPADVLEPAMQLDADLGIDSIKRVEILAAIQERLPNAPIIGPEHLGTIRTLGEIADFLAGGATETTAAPINTPLLTDGSTTDFEADEPPVRRLIPTLVPLVDSGRTTGALPVDGDVWVGDDGSPLAAAVVARLGELGHQVVNITTLDEVDPTAPNGLAALVLFAAPKAGGGANLDAFRLLRAAAPSLRQAGRFGAACVAVTRLGGTFALGGIATGQPTDADSGGLVGLVKTAGHEWPEVNCKAIDVDPTWDVTAAAAAITAEMTVRGPSEVGLSPRGKVKVGLKAVALDVSESVSPLGPNDVVLVSGGARGVTAEVAVALAEAFRPTVVLLGRSPAPEPEPDWLRPLLGEAAIKRALHGRATGKVSPQSLHDEHRRIAANREVLANLRRIEAHGARVLYRSVDVRNRAAVATIVDSIRGEVGPIRGLIHGAGVLADRKIEDQTDDQFAQVFGTKVGGLDALLAAVGTDELRALVLFSSSTARFGRTGQVAYAAANEVLNKRAAVEAAARPGCRVISVNWGPWAGGMVTPGLKALFEAEGIATIPLRAGASYLVNELRATAARPTEVVILGGGGPEPDFLADEPDHAPVALAPAPTAELAPSSSLTTVFERVLDLESTPILRSHVMDGRPVLPMALILEWLGQAAMTRHPGMVFAGVDDLRVLKGVVLRGANPETIRVLAGKAERFDDRTVVPVELRGTLADGRDVLHARGSVVLGDGPTAPPEHPAAVDPLNLPPHSQSVRAIYRDVLFHGAALHGIRQVEGCGDAGIIAEVGAAPAPSAWLARPLRQQWLTDPLAVDSAFQLMIVWSVDRLGAGSLPTFVGQYRQYRRSFPKDGTRVEIRVTESSPHKARADVDFRDAAGVLVARIESYECVIDASLQSAFRRNGHGATQQVGSK